MRPIDADVLKRELDKNDANLMFDDMGVMEGLIDDAPTVDAVPVVRCRECKYRNTWQYENCYCEPGETCCTILDVDMNLDGFCYRGAKMEEL